jgi:hypothetical protein
MRRVLLLSAAAAFPALAHAGDLGINVYGISYHFNRDKAREIGVDNWLNPGLGLRYRLPHGDRLDWFFDAGAYHDGGRNTAVLAGAGGLWHASERLRLGAALAFFHSKTYNGGRPFIAPVPLAAYEFRSATLNAFYAPKVRDVNSVNTVGFWLTVWLR